LTQKAPEVVTVTVTEQLPDERVQVVEESVTLPLPETFDHVTVPVCEEKVPDTVAVHVISEPTLKDDEVQTIATAVLAFPTFTLFVVWGLPLLFESPL